MRRGAWTQHLAGCVITCLASLAGSMPALAGTLAFTTGSGVTDNHAPNDPVNLGLWFTPTTSMTVDALGFFVQADLTAGEIVGLYTSSGTLLASVAVALTDPVVSRYYLHAITPVTLTAGQTYVVDAYTGNNTWSYSSTAPAVAAGITYDYHAYDYTSGLAFPTNQAGAGGGAGGVYYGPTFDIATDTPEPASLGLFTLAVGALGWLRRSRPALMVR